MECPVITIEGAGAGSVELAEAVFAVPVRADILHRVVEWQRAKRRAGTHAVKTRGEVVGSTRKIYRQKGTGRARHATRQAPQFRGGGVVFGPQVRDHGYALPKKVRKLGLKTALSAKLAEGKLKVLEAAHIDEPKTKLLAKALGALGWGSVLVIDGAAVDTNFARAARNLPGVRLLPEVGANVYDILKHDTLVLTRAAVTALETRLA